MGAKLKSLFNPSSTPKVQRLPAKIWELLRRNDGFRQEVEKLWNLDQQAGEETKKYTEVVRRYNKAISDRDASRGEWQQHYDSIKDRPIRKNTFNLIEKHQKTHPLAALALLWLVPEPLFAASRVREGQLEEGTGLSPDLKNPSWVWWRSNEPQGAIGHYTMRGPEIGSHFEDWQTWQLGQKLFDYTTPWVRLPISFKSAFVRAWQQNYDLKDAYEFEYIYPPRQTDTLTPADFSQYLEFLETVMRRRLFAISPSILTTKDVNEVFARLQFQIKRSLPESRDHLFGTEAAWNHYLAIKERKLSFQEHIIGDEDRATPSTEITQKVRNHRRNVQSGVKTVEKLISLIYPLIDLKQMVRVRSAPPRDKTKRRKP
jgi:hypothetical protein